MADSTLTCPICHRAVTRETEAYPFCSRRCRLIDLGKWAEEGYVIHAPVNDPDVLGGAEGSGADDDDSEESGRPRTKQ